MNCFCEMSDSRCSGELMRVVTLKMRVLCGILRATPGDVRSESGNRGADEYKFGLVHDPKNSTNWLWEMSSGI